VSWALRTIGKRSALRSEAFDMAALLAASSDAAARWVGREALRELKRR
jgi:3-methyladenine DNA glycosylase AlkD